MITATRASATPNTAPVAASTAYTTDSAMRAYRVHLQAENKSRATVSLWTGALRQFSTYLQAKGMPTDVTAIRREHLEQWLADLLAGGSAASIVNNRYRSLQPFWKWLVEEDPQRRGMRLGAGSEWWARRGPRVRPARRAA